MCGAALHRRSSTDAVLQPLCDRCHQFHRLWVMCRLPGSGKSLCCPRMCLPSCTRLINGAGASSPSSSSPTPHGEDGHSCLEPAKSAHEFKTVLGAQGKNGPAKRRPGRGRRGLARPRAGTRAGEACRRPLQRPTTARRVHSRPAGRRAGDATAASSEAGEALLGARGGRHAEHVEADRLREPRHRRAVDACMCSVRALLELRPVTGTAQQMQRRTLDSGRHSPMVTVSPSRTRKHGETCAGVLEWRFSYRWYFRTKWKYSLRCEGRCAVVGERSADARSPRSAPRAPAVAVAGRPRAPAPLHDDGAVHLGRLDHPRHDAAADGHVAGEGALLVDVLPCGGHAAASRYVRRTAKVREHGDASTGAKVAQPQSRSAGQPTARLPAPQSRGHGAPRMVSGQTTSKVIRGAAKPLTTGQEIPAAGQGRVGWPWPSSGPPGRKSGRPSRPRHPQCILAAARATKWACRACPDPGSALASSRARRASQSAQGDTLGGE